MADKQNRNAETRRTQRTSQREIGVIFTEGPSMPTNPALSFALQRLFLLSGFFCLTVFRLLSLLALLRWMIQFQSCQKTFS
ncbi:MAG: hypothetical protein B9S30_02060 [Verrucomicrobiia bacterium Tous-C5FEB]|nr:MAG: hypothetical protein B9S30_02060 [Verrucomicrobiae bacterium Tous-C5FEB]